MLRGVGQFDPVLSTVPSSQQSQALTSVESHVSLALTSVDSHGSLALTSVESHGSLALTSVESHGSLALTSVEGHGSLALTSVESHGSLALTSVESHDSLNHLCILKTGPENNDDSDCKDMSRFFATICSYPFRTQPFWLVLPPQSVIPHAKKDIRGSTVVNPLSKSSLFQTLIFLEASVITCQAVARSHDSTLIMIQSQFTGQSLHVNWILIGSLIFPRIHQNQAGLLALLLLCVQWPLALIQR